MRPSVARLAAACGLGLILLAPRAHASPEDAGPLPVVAWDAGSVTLAGARIHVVTYRPRGAARRPLVGVVHGASRTGAYQRVLAETLASYGLVAVVPDMPCTVLACDHAANAAQLLALLDWAAAQSESPASPLAGAVDGARRGLVGHSWGALASELAAARGPSLASLVLLDPNDDARVGAAAARQVRAPTLQLLAERRGTCNNQWSATAISPALGGPWLQVTVPRSGHCDPEAPTDALCGLFCGAGGSAATTAWFRRYAVAWTLCNLAADAAMAPWVGGAAFDADVRAGLLAGASRSGLDGLACRSVDAGIADAGVADVGAPDDAPALEDVADASEAGSAQDAADAPDANTADGSATDARLSDAGADVPAVDAGAPAGTEGCRCAAAGAGPRAPRAVLLATALVVAATRRRRSRPPRARGLDGAGRRHA